MESLVQRAGRGGRNTDAPAKFIVVYPQRKISTKGSVADPIVLKEEEDQGVTAFPRSAIPTPTSPTTLVKEAPPKKREKPQKKWQARDTLEAAGFTEEKDDEDVLHFFEGKGCLRARLNAYYANDKATDLNCTCTRCSKPTPPQVACCSECDPLLLAIFDGILQVKSEKKRNKIRVPDEVSGDGDEAAFWDLTMWASRKLEPIGGWFGGGSMILCREMAIRIVHLVKLRHVSSATNLLEQTDWAYAMRFGDEVLSLLAPHFHPLPDNSVSSVLLSAQDTGAPRLPLKVQATNATRQYQCGNCDAYGHSSTF